MGILASIAGWAISNPLMILGAIGIWVATGWISDVKGYFETRSRDAAWAYEVDQRDKVAAAKDEMINSALLSRDNAHVEIANLRAELDDAEAKRKLAGIADCVWSRDDVRVLNSGRPRR